VIPAARSLVPAASSSDGIIALTAPAAAPAMTLTAVFFSALVAPLAFLFAARLTPDFLATVLDLADRDDDLFRLTFAAITSSVISHSTATFAAGGRGALTTHSQTSLRKARAM
jgi:hypothetical protein